MKLTVTTVLIVAALAFVGWTLYSRLSSPAPVLSSTTGSGSSGAAVTVSVADALGEIAKTIGQFARTTPSTQGGNSGTV